MSVKQNKRAARGRHHRAAASPREKQATAPLFPPAYFRRKAFVDRIVAAVLLVPGLPIMLLLLLLVRLTSRGPGIYRQVRVGRDGHKFKIYKIRTMRHDAESRTGAVWTQTHHDPRITRLGRTLRRFHLDELPQLLNVVRGEMSIVGPRPERPEFVHVLAESIPGYYRRMMVRPGITGLAQLNLPPDSDLRSVRRKLALDCEYICHASAWLDLRIFLCTGLRMMKVPEGWLLHGFRLRRDVAIEGAPANGPCAGGGNGNGHSPQSNPLAATPAALLCDAAEAAAEKDERRVKKACPRHAPIKPR